jgi:polysaccharide export outer membrane protein
MVVASLALVLPRTYLQDQEFPSTERRYMSIFPFGFRPLRQASWLATGTALALLWIAVVAMGPATTPATAPASQSAAPGEPSAVRTLAYADNEAAATSIQLCQITSDPEACGPVCSDGYRALKGVDCQPGCGEPDWHDQRMIPWQAFGQGEYVGPARCEHVPTYRLRVDDVIDCIYRLTREELSHPYQLQVGDVIRVESVNNPEITREVQVQPDGNITLLLLGTVRAVRRTIPELTKDLEERYLAVLRRPSLTVTPVKINTRLEDLRASVDNRFFSGGQGRQVRVMPDGTIHLPGIGAVPAQGLTLGEMQMEIEERYREIVDGLEVTPILYSRAPRFVYVAGEVRAPGRYTLEQPTTSMMAISLAGGTNNGGNLREIVVFRRTDDWKLMATRIDLNGALLGKRPGPADEIWLRDSDIVLVPKSPLLRADNFLELVFTRGLYSVVPAQTFFTQKTSFGL